MKRLVLICLALLCIIQFASATAFSAWSPYGDAWKANNDTFTVVMWNSSGTHTWLASGNASTVQYLIVGGGGGGGAGSSDGYVGAGGGAGGYRNSTSYESLGLMYVIVGSGGAGGIAGNGAYGGNSSFGNLSINISSAGGGYGAYGATGSHNGGNGGSGGGAGGDGGTPGSGNIPTSSPSQGYSGGSVAGSGYSGGGGGAGGIAVTKANGPGITDMITGTGVLYSVGGNSTGYAGISVIPPSKLNNTGNGGDGGWKTTGGAGGSGIVIISYKNAIPIASNFTASPNPQTVNFPIVFTDTSTGSPTTWNWTFGDLDAGNTSTSQNPTRTYKTAGNYTVKLNVSNATGQFSEYSHFQLINPLGVGEVDTFSLIAPSSTARKWTIDPKKMDYSAPSGQAITQINMNVPLGTTGTFTVYQSNGESTSGSYTYTGYPYSTLVVSIGGSSYPEKMTQPTVPMTMKLIISPSIVKNQSTGRALSLAYGWGVGSAAAISHIISQPVEPSPIMRFTFNADNDMTATAYTDDYTTSVKNWLQGYSDSANDLLSSIGNYVEKIKAIAGSAFTIAYGLWYWIDYLFIKNLAMTVSLYISGTMAFAMLSSKNIYSFYKTWFRQQKALYEFIGTAVSTVVSIITMIINAIKPT